MPTNTQHIPHRCPVYLHPAAATSPQVVKRIQRSTGLLIIVNLGRITTAIAVATVITDDKGPSGGAAA